MAFNSILKDLAKRAGGTGAALLSMDGEVVASFSESPAIEIDLIGAHHGIILNIIKESAASQKESAAVKTVSISTDNARLAISTLKDGFYLVLAMDKSRYLGKALSESARAVKKLEKEIG